VAFREDYISDKLIQSAIWIFIYNVNHVDSAMKVSQKPNKTTIKQITATMMSDMYDVRLGIPTSANLRGVLYYDLSTLYLHGLVINGYY
jgi:hypothetical protein